MSKVPQSFIKSVALEIDSHYELNNTPFGINEKKSSKKRIPFIGRTQHIGKFLEFLKSKKSTGVFLVTGFRGMGKTSFVNHVLRSYKLLKSLRLPFFWLDQKFFENIPWYLHRIFFSKRKSNKIKTIQLTLTQNNPKEIDILRLIVSSVFDDFKSYIDRYSLLRKLEWFYGLWKQLFLGAILMITPFIIQLFYPIRQYITLADKHIADFTFQYFHWLNSKFSWLSWFSWERYQVFAVSLIFIYGFTFCIIKLIIYVSSKNDSAANRIRRLFERCYNTLSIEDDGNIETTIPVVNFKLSAGGEKRTKQFPIASNKEIEYELQQFLTKAKKEYQLEFVFIFDELDKVEPIVSNADLYGDIEEFEKQKYVNAYERNIRDRKQAIINIIAGLKNFFTTANARFIFIAGNEMFDASLADISDRQSSISSIFTFVFNIESLLKEKDLMEGIGTVNNLSLSDAIEYYLKALLFHCNRGELRENLSLYRMALDKYQFIDQDKTSHDENAKKVFFILQNFISFLTYRSNGSPKKLIKEIHEFIKVGTRNEIFASDQTIVGSLIARKPANPSFGSNFKYYQKRLLRSFESRNKRKTYLYFNYYNQYRIGFINYLYRPFLIKYGRSFKLYSDNLIVSTPYLFDHLIKFHQFAFSMSYLELVPEVLSTNKTPALRSHIKKIIEYLGANHIREIEVGLFDYKFNSRTLNEITYLSKIYEQEAAAMNYTLDESYMVKLHQINKIKELRYIYSTFNARNGSDSESKQIFSIAHLNATLGDLHFFDQEYDDAIVAYSDAIRPITTQAISTMNMQDFITLNRNRLKIGLCFEKTSSYEDALAQYSNTSMDAIRFMNYRIDSEEFLDIKYNNFGFGMKKPRKKNGDSAIQETKDDRLYHSASLSDLLQIIQQGFLAQLYIQEKKSVAGISAIKLYMAVGSYFKVTEGFLSHHSRNHIVKANAFLHAGNLMYYKNTDIQHDLHADYTYLLPANIVDNLNKLNAAFGAKFSAERRSALSLYLYILGIVETFAFGNDKSFITDSIDKICKKPNISAALLKFLKREININTESFRSIRYNYLATFLSNIGDSLLSNYKLKDAPKANYNKFTVDEIFNFSKWDLAQKDKFKPLVKRVGLSGFLRPINSNQFGIVDILTAYEVSAKYFLKQGRAASAAFQYTKILYLLRLVLTKEKNGDKKCSDYIKKIKGGERIKAIDLIEQTIVIPALQLISQNAENTDRHMLNKATSGSGLDLDANYSLNNLSNHPETREVILLFNYIKVRLGLLTDSDRPSVEVLISPLNSFATQHSRLLELAFYARFIDHNEKNDFTTYHQKDTDGKLSETKQLENTVLVDRAVEYLYCRLSILQIMDIYGCDYWMGFSYIAFTHMTVAFYLKDWCDELKKDVKDGLSKFLGKGSFAGLDQIYHFAKAKTLYKKAVQLQTGGDAYRVMVDDMIYLEDDFNDNAYHFGAALDRYMIVNGVFEDRIERCQAAIDGDHTFDPDKYL